MDTQNKKPVILIIDDEPAVRHAFKEILEDNGNGTMEASTGEEGMRMMRDNPPDLLILDSNLPDTDGIKMTRDLKSNKDFHHIPIIIVTGQDAIESRIAALQAGADDYLTKPPHVLELVTRVKNLVKVKEYQDFLTNQHENLERQVLKRTVMLKQSISDLKAVQEDTIFRLSLASEYRDDDTSVHLHKMSHYAAALAKKAGLDNSHVNRIRHSMPMHDIGKIGIPDRVLLKPSALSAEEWTMMKTHTTIGAKILEDSNSEYLEMGCVIALTHHEKYDGTGYPTGLSGEKIPIEGRIASLADIFDALTSKRPYKAALSFEESIDIMKTSRWTHFDPKLLDHFLAIKDEIRSIKHQFDNPSKTVLSRTPS
jgi:putative two-component system response regulator